MDEVVDTVEVLVHLNVKVPTKFTNGVTRTDEELKLSALGEVYAACARNQLWDLVALVDVT